MGKKKSVRVAAFEAACKRYFSKLFLHWGLHPTQAEAISLGIDWPYRLRTFCWTIYQRTGGGTSCRPVYSILDRNGKPRDPVLEIDLPTLIRGHFARHMKLKSGKKGQITEQKIEQWRQTQLGKEDQRDVDRKAEERMLDIALQEAQPQLDFALRRDPDVLEKLGLVEKV